MKRHLLHTTSIVAVSIKYVFLFFDTFHAWNSYWGRNQIKFYLQEKKKTCHIRFFSFEFDFLLIFIVQLLGSSVGFFSEENDERNPNWSRTTYFLIE